MIFERSLTVNSHVGSVEKMPFDDKRFDTMSRTFRKNGFNIVE